MLALASRDANLAAGLGCKASGVAKEINYILFSTRWWFQNCKVFLSAEFFASSRRLVVAELRIRIKSKKFSRCSLTAFYLEKLRDKACAQEYAMTVFHWFKVVVAHGENSFLMSNCIQITLYGHMSNNIKYRYGNRR